MARTVAVGPADVGVGVRPVPPTGSGVGVRRRGVAVARGVALRLDVAGGAEVDGPSVREAVGEGIVVGGDPAGLEEVAPPGVADVPG